MTLCKLHSLEYSIELVGLSNQQAQTLQLKHPYQLFLLSRAQLLSVVSKQSTCTTILKQILQLFLSIYELQEIQPELEELKIFSTLEFFSYFSSTVDNNEALVSNSILERIIEEKNQFLHLLQQTEKCWSSALASCITLQQSIQQFFTTTCRTFEQMSKFVTNDTTTAFVSLIQKPMQQITKQGLRIGMVATDLADELLEQFSLFWNEPILALPNFSVSKQPIQIQYGTQKAFQIGSNSKLHMIDGLFLECEAYTSALLEQSEKVNIFVPIPLMKELLIEIHLFPPIQKSFSNQHLVDVLFLEQLPQRRFTLMIPLITNLEDLLQCLERIHQQKQVHLLQELCYTTNQLLQIFYNLPKEEEAQLQVSCQQICQQMMQQVEEAAKYIKNDLAAEMKQLTDDNAILNWVLEVGNAKLQQKMEFCRDTVLQNWKLNPIMGMNTIAAQQMQMWNLKSEMEQTFLNKKNGTSNAQSNNPVQKVNSSNNVKRQSLARMKRNQLISFQQIEVQWTQYCKKFFEYQVSLIREEFEKKKELIHVNLFSMKEEEKNKLETEILPLHMQLEEQLFKLQYSDLLSEKEYFSLTGTDKWMERVYLYQVKNELPIWRQVYLCQYLYHMKSSQSVLPILGWYTANQSLILVIANQFARKTLKEYLQVSSNQISLMQKMCLLIALIQQCIWLQSLPFSVPVDCLTPPSILVNEFDNVTINPIPYDESKTDFAHHNLHVLPFQAPDNNGKLNVVYSLGKLTCLLFFQTLHVTPEKIKDKNLKLIYHQLIFKMCIEGSKRPSLQQVLQETSKTFAMILKYELSHDTFDYSQQLKLSNGLDLIQSIRQCKQLSFNSSTKMPLTFLPLIWFDKLETIVFKGAALHDKHIQQLTSYVDRLTQIRVMDFRDAFIEGGFVYTLIGKLIQLPFFSKLYCKHAKLSPYGLQLNTKTEFSKLEISNLLQLVHEFVLQQVKSKKLQLKDFIDSEPIFSNDENILFACVTTDGLSIQDFTPENQKQPKYIAAALEQNGLALQFIENKTLEYMQIALQQNGLALQFVDAQSFLQQTDVYRELVMMAVKQNGLALQYAEESFKADKEIVLAAIQQNGNALEFAESNLSQNKFIVLKALNRKEGRIDLQKVPRQWKQDKEFILEACYYDGNMLELASDELKNEEGIVLIACKSSPQALRFASSILQSNATFLNKLIKANRQVFDFVNKSLLSEEQWQQLKQIT